MRPEVGPLRYIYENLHDNLQYDLYRAMEIYIFNMYTNVQFGYWYRNTLYIYMMDYHWLVSPVLVINQKLDLLVI